MNVIQSNTKNYLVPSSGNTHGVNFNGVFTAVPYDIDWRQFSIDNFPFQPQGVFIDNSLGTASLIINFQPLNFNVVCPAGIVGQFQFPAADNQTCSITGIGQAVVTFVDFPVLPNSGITQIGNTVNVNITGPNPVPVSLPTGGGPYATQETPLPVAAYYGSITGAGVTNTITPANNTNLRKVSIKLSGNASNAGGTDLLTLTLNGVVIFKENIYIPAAAATGLGSFSIDLDFSMLGLNVGTGGLVTTLATALTTGILDINAYFG